MMLHPTVVASAIVSASLTAVHPQPSWRGHAGVRARSASARTAPVRTKVADDVEQVEYLSLREPLRSLGPRRSRARSSQKAHHRRGWLEAQFPGWICARTYPSCEKETAETHLHFVEYAFCQGERGDVGRSRTPAVDGLKPSTLCILIRSTPAREAALRRRALNLMMLSSTSLRMTTAAWRCFSVISQMIFKAS
jgi:hypothetical protein